MPEAYLRFAQEAVAIYRDLGDSPGIATALQELGWAQLQLGHLEEARINLDEAKNLSIGLRDKQKVGECSNGLGMLALLQGQLQQARPLFEDALKAFKDLRDTYWVALMELIVSQVDRREGKFDDADKHMCAGLAAFQQLDSLMGTMWALYSFADLALHRGQHERALRLVGASHSLRERVGEMPTLAMATMGDVGEAARSLLDEGTAEGLYHEGLTMELDDAVAYALQHET
jgi:tetratricopeptide (TPR) repeat protein